LILRLCNTRFPIKKDRTNAPATITKIKIPNCYVPGWLSNYIHRLLKLIVYYIPYPAIRHYLGPS